MIDGARTMLWNNNRLGLRGVGGWENLVGRSQVWWTLIESKCGRLTLGFSTGHVNVAGRIGVMFVNRCLNHRCRVRDKFQQYLTLGGHTRDRFSRRIHTIDKVPTTRTRLESPWWETTVFDYLFVVVPRSKCARGRGRGKIYVRVPDSDDNRLRLRAT